MLNGLLLLADPHVILYMVVGVLAGLITGVLPGLSGPMLLALAIPLTFYMGPVDSILFLVGLHMANLYAGSITAILINTPGKPAAAVTALDGYPLTLKGQSRKAIQMSTVSTLFASTLSVLALIMFAPMLGKIALLFGPPEYFALGIFGISVVAAIAGKSLPKGIVAAAFGVFLSTIGADPIFGLGRFSFGIPNLESGIAMIPALTGLFAVCEVLVQVSKKLSPVVSPAATEVKKHKVEGEGLTFPEIRQSIKTMFKGGIIGVIVGALPGTGSLIASFLSYNEAIRSSETPEKYGKGELDGLAAAESGSIAVESAALIPLLTFGIPGDVATAILLGAFILHGIRVGPDLFTQFGSIINAMFLGIILLELLIFVLGWYGSNLLSKLGRIPRPYMFSVITVLIVCGSFALNNSMFDVWVTLVFGLLGYLMLRREFPIPPLLLGIILGPIIESNFSRSISLSGGSLAIFLTRPITVGILILSVFTVIISLRVHKTIQKKLAVGGH